MSTILAALALAVQAPSGLLVTAAELAALLKDPAVVVIAAGNRPAEFEAGHVPGARFVHYDHYAVDANGLSSELPPVDDLRRVLAAAGIGDRSKVIIYGTPIAATRLFFTLDYLGHPDVRILNGGLAAWRAAGGGIETGPARAVTPLVSYCLVGMRASVAYFVARHLGYDARLYDGSIDDWTQRKLPAVKGQ
jgi:3-mercaptopyruvate sulfurtransferase SseA